MDEFSEAFQRADQVVLTDIYAPPPEKAIPGISSTVLAERIQERANQMSTLIPRQQDVAAFLENVVEPNDLVLVMGAGPIWRAAYELLERLQRSLISWVSGS